LSVGIPRFENRQQRKTMSWFYLDTGKGESAWNMALDEALLLAVANIGRPILRFYGWNKPAATFGYFQKYADIAAWTSLRPLIRRPTGGGLVPHDADWTYSVIIPPSHPWYGLRAAESYLHLHRWVAAALRAANIAAELAPGASKEIPGQCFAGAEQHDILLNDLKIAGAAQRRAREGLLIQGSIQSLPATADRRAWQDTMRMNAAIWAEFVVTPDIHTRAAEFAEAKYSQPSHNQRR
jgi:lipoate-protein ligase A